MAASVGEDFLRKADVQRRMGVSLSKVNRLLASGRIAAKKDGRTVLISAASLAHYLDNLPPATFRTSADRAA